MHWGMRRKFFKGRREEKFNNGHSVEDRRSDFNRVPGKEQRARLKTLEDLDQRSRALKHAKKFTRAMISDLGGEGNVTRAQQELIHRAAMCSVLLGDMEARHLRYLDSKAKGEAIPVERYTALINAQNRLIHALGLKRIARTVDGSLEDYAAKRIAQDVEDEDE